MFGGEPLQLPTFDIARSTKKKLNVEKGIILKLFGSSEKIRDGIMHSITHRKKEFLLHCHGNDRAHQTEPNVIFFVANKILSKTRTNPLLNSDKFLNVYTVKAGQIQGPS